MFAAQLEKIVGLLGLCEVIYNVMLEVGLPPVNLKGTNTSSEDSHVGRVHISALFYAGPWSSVRNDRSVHHSVSTKEIRL